MWYLKMKLHFDSKKYEKRLTVEDTCWGNNKQRKDSRTRRLLNRKTRTEFRGKARRGTKGNLFKTLKEYGFAL